MKKAKSILNKIKHTQYITESDLKYILHMINKNNYQFFIDNILFILPIKLSKDQNEKGFRWLWSRYKDSLGNIKENNPFFKEQIYILENFSHMEFHRIYNIMQNFPFSKYVPEYKVYSKNDKSFNYVVQSGEPLIL